MNELLVAKLTIDTIVVQHIVAGIDKKLPDRPETVSRWLNGIETIDVVVSQSELIVVYEPVL
jgi:hypothetical protein